MDFGHLHRFVMSLASIWYLPPSSAVKSFTSELSDPLSLRLFSINAFATSNKCLCYFNQVHGSVSLRVVGITGLANPGRKCRFILKE